MQAALKHTQDKALVELNAAASSGDMETVTLLLTRGLPVNAGDHDKRTALVRSTAPLAAGFALSFRAAPLSCACLQLHTSALMPVASRGTVLLHTASLLPFARQFSRLTHV